MVLGEDWLRTLSNAVATALDECAHHHDYAVDGQFVRTHVAEDLPIEEHSEKSHRNIDEECRESHHHNLTREKYRYKWHLYPQGTVFAEEVCGHEGHGDHLADECRKACAKDSHFAGEHEEVVTEDIENAACQHSERG